MQVFSRSPLTVASLVWQPLGDRWVLTVVCKATFILRPGTSPLAPEQEAPRAVDTYVAHDERQSLLGATDLVPFKSAPEVLVTGSAHAPGGAPVTSLRVLLSVGSVKKQVDVVGDRFFTLSGALTDPAPFLHMPLVWERAAGGPGTWNPVGVGMGDVATPSDSGLIAAPNLQLPGSMLKDQSDVLVPIGVGPIASHWPSRASRWPTTATESWDDQRWTEQPLPAGLLPGFFNAAPEDQQLSELRGDELIVLEHLHPEYPRLETSLERVTPHAVIYWAGGQGEKAIELRCDTLCIDADRGRATLTWRGHVPLGAPSRERQGHVLVTLRPVEHAEERPAQDDPERTMGLDALQQHHVAAMHALPFGGAFDRGAPAVGDSADAVGRGDAVVSGPEPSDPERTVDIGHVTQQAAGVRALPFAEPRAPGDPETTLDTGWATEQAVPARALPFSDTTVPWGVSQPSFPAAAQPSSPDLGVLDPAIAVDVERTLLATPVVAQSPLPFNSSPDGSAPPRAPGSLPDLELALAPEASPEALRWVDPPPLIGPLASRLGAESRAEEANAAVEASPPDPPEVVVEVPVWAPELPISDYPLVRCAAISASLARRPEALAEIVAEHHLTSPSWEGLRRHWDEAIREESLRGRAERLRAHDIAFVEQLERERGPITPEDYASLCVAAERGRRDEALAALDLPREAVLSIERVYLTRTVQDSKLRARVRAALIEARQG